MALSARQAVELFHLVFLRALVAKGEDKALIALKGGCNLRFYFASVRYSEDIDFDVTVISKGTLKNKVDRLLMSPLIATQAAIAQKIHALAGRTEPQARDVFDLNLLLARPDADAVPLTDAQRAWIPDAIERAMSISFDDYTSKVVSYLDPTQAELFEDRPAWDAMQDAVVARLEALR